MLLAVVALFVFGSIRNRLDKNALTFGAALVVVAAFWGVWWPGAEPRQVIAREGWMPLFRVVADACLQNDLDSTFTPVQWIRAMSGLRLSLFVMLTVAIYVCALLGP